MSACYSYEFRESVGAPAQKAEKCATSRVGESRRRTAKRDDAAVTTKVKELQSVIRNADKEHALRPDQASLDELKRQTRDAREALREQQVAAGLMPRIRPSIRNRTSSYATVEEERNERQEVTTSHMQVMRHYLPRALKTVAGIKDFRNPKTMKHRMAVLMLYGVLMFVYQMTSRRDANQRMTRAMLLTNLREFFPECTSAPHQDTLGRVLSGIEVEEIQAVHIDLVRRLIRQKKFERYLIDRCYPVAIDGTQKLIRDLGPNAHWGEKKAGKLDEVSGEKEARYTVYVLEASLAFHNGMTIPLMTEFLDATKDDLDLGKQDCEQRGFARLAAKIKKAFPHLRIMLLLDGLYPNGPILDSIEENHWQYMIVLQDGSLTSVWDEYHGLLKLTPTQYELKWGNRRQIYRWVNDIEYWYGPNGRHHKKVHLVVCEESWEEVDSKSGQKVPKRSKHAWLSSKPLGKKNLHERCNLAARHRWGIEKDFLVEKHHGYQYEHCFSHNWSAMKGYHYLMRLAHLLNTLALNSTALAKIVQELGYHGFLKFVWETMAAPWLLPEVVRARLAEPFQLRLV